MREKLTVLIPCKNEANNIAECIASVRDVADEILIADSLSTDDTLEIVRQAGGCRIIEREFVGYADFKNWAIPQAAHPWVLIVDADERCDVTQRLRIHRGEALGLGLPGQSARRDGGVGARGQGQRAVAQGQRHPVDDDGDDVEPARRMLQRAATDAVQRAPETRLHGPAHHRQPWSGPHRHRVNNS